MQNNTLIVIKLEEVRVALTYPLERFLLLRCERREPELRARPLSILHLHGVSSLEAGTHI